MDYKYHGIVLEKFDAAETDRVYGIYTEEEGRVRVIGKGVRKAGAKLAGFLEPVTLGEFFVAKNRGTGKVTGAIIHNNYENIKSDYPATKKVFESLRIFKKIITGQEQDRIMFGILKEYLDEIENNISKRDYESVRKMEIITLGFKYKLLEYSGYRINVETCGVCHAKLISGKNYFSSEKGGMICEVCSRKINRKISVSDSSIKVLRIFSGNSIGNYHKIVVDDKDVKNLNAIINDEILWVIG
jgi:DNA repair protein RecO (recombination protein O)